MGSQELSRASLATPGNSFYHNSNFSLVSWLAERVCLTNTREEIARKRDGSLRTVECKPEVICDLWEYERP